MKFPLYGALLPFSRTCIVLVACLMSSAAKAGDYPSGGYAANEILHPQFSVDGGARHLDGDATPAREWVVWCDRLRDSPRGGRCALSKFGPIDYRKYKFDLVLLFPGDLHDPVRPRFFLSRISDGKSFHERDGLELLSFKLDSQDYVLDDIDMWGGHSDTFIRDLLAASEASIRWRVAGELEEHEQKISLSGLDNAFRIARSFVDDGGPIDIDAGTLKSWLHKHAGEMMSVLKMFGHEDETWCPALRNQARDTVSGYFATLEEMYGPEFVESVRPVFGPPEPGSPRLCEKMLDFLTWQARLPEIFDVVIVE